MDQSKVKPRESKVKPREYYRFLATFQFPHSVMRWLRIYGCGHIWFSNQDDSPGKEWCPNCA